MSSDPPGWSTVLPPSAAAAGEWMMPQRKTAASHPQSDVMEGNGRRAPTSTAIGSHPRRPFSSSDEASSSSSIVTSWVPKIDQEMQRRQQGGNLSDAARQVLKTAVPTKSWEVGRRSDDDDDDDDMRGSATRTAGDPFWVGSHTSWAPHLHPNGPLAVAPASTQKLVNVAWSSDSHEEETVEEDVTIDEETMDGDDESGSIIEEEIISADGDVEDELIEVMADDEDEEEHVSYGDLSSTPNHTENAEAAFPKQREQQKQQQQQQLRQGRRHTQRFHESGDPVSSMSTKQQQQQQQSSSFRIEDDDYNDENGDGSGRADFILVEKGDNFQIFDDDCRFAPSRGTLVVLCLCVVLALEGVGVGLYFALRK